MKTHFSSKVSRQPFSLENAAIGTLFLFGVVLRLRQYLSGRSLWADEAMLALNIVNRDFSGLLKPLADNQGAPIGFLFVEKFFNVILGRHELVLRLFPLMAGLTALWLFYLLLKKSVHHAGFFTALTLFALSPQLIYYSSESKQYIVDVAVMLGLLVTALPIFQGQAGWQDHIRLGLAGIFALWFSHPAVFVLAGIGVALVIQFLQTRDYSNLRLTVIMGIFWLVSLGLLYFINLQGLTRSEYLVNYWETGFIPMPPWDNLAWFATNFSDNVQFQFGIQVIPGLVFVFMLTGWLALFREMQTLALTFIFTVFFAYIASALRLYPTSGRLSLFMMPFGIILLGKAVEMAQGVFESNKIWTTLITLALSGYLLYSPFTTALQDFVSPKYFEHIRPSMDYLSASWKDGDVIFVSFWAEPAFRFYAPFYDLENIQYVSSDFEDYPNPQALKSRFEPLLGQGRVWVLFSHVYENAGFNERDFLTAYLDEIGMKRREFRRPETSVYLFLYDLRK
jgi:hypothetical protein